MFSKKVLVSSGVMSSLADAIVLSACSTELYSCFTLAVFFSSFTCGFGSRKMEDGLPTWRNWRGGAVVHGDVAPRGVLRVLKMLDGLNENSAELDNMSA